MSNNIEVHSTTNNSLEDLLNQLYYDRVTWCDGTNPAINADNLNKSEIALELLLGKQKLKNGYLHQILNALIEEIETRIDNDSTLETLINELKKTKANTSHSHVLNDITNYKPTDLTGYATEEWVNEQNFIKEIPDSYVTDLELDNKGYLTQHQDLSEYAKKSDIPSLNEYATKEYVTNAIPDTSKFITSIPTEYITETELDLKKYATEEYVTEIFSGVDVPDSLINSGDTVILKCGSSTELIT